MAKIQCKGNCTLKCYWKECKITQTFWKTFWQLNIHVPGDPATLLSGDAVGKRGLLVTGFVTTL